MGRRTTQRLLATGVLALLGAAAAAAGSAPALAAQPKGLELVAISGVDLTEPVEVEVRAEDRPELCAALYREVSWLAGRKSDTGEPEAETLGPQYTMVVHLDGEPRHRFHLYPLAEGGPKAFRPAEQPGDRSGPEGWFHGRLSLPETLSSAGVPLTGSPPAGGGTGGGEPAPTESAPPDHRVLAFLEEWREGMLLTAAVTITVAAGLGGVAYLIRRKV